MLTRLLRLVFVVMGAGERKLGHARPDTLHPWVLQVARHLPDHAALWHATWRYLHTPCCAPVAFVCAPLIVSVVECVEGCGAGSEACVNAFRRCWPGPDSDQRKYGYLFLVSPFFGIMVLAAYAVYHVLALAAPVAVVACALGSGPGSGSCSGVGAFMPDWATWAAHIPWVLACLAPLAAFAYSVLVLHDWCDAGSALACGFMWYLAWPAINSNPPRLTRAP